MGREESELGSCRKPEGAVSDEMRAREAKTGCGRLPERENQEHTRKKVKFPQSRTI